LPIADHYEGDLQVLSILSKEWTVPSILKDNELVALFLDLDLSILGADEEVYDAYSRQIRKEYIHVPLSDYQHGRISVLKSFLKRDRLFFTSHFHPHEQKARENILQEVSSLESVAS